MLPFLMQPIRHNIAAGGGSQSLPSHRAIILMRGGTDGGTDLLLECQMYAPLATSLASYFSFSISFLGGGGGGDDGNSMKDLERTNSASLDLKDENMTLTTRASLVRLA